MSSKVERILEFFLTMRMRTSDLLIFGVTNHQVTPHVASVDGLVTAETAVEDLGAVVVDAGLQELHHTAHA